MTSEEVGEWQECVADKDYEIFSEFPFQIRKKSNKRIVKESIDKDGYIRCHLNCKDYRKHRIVALQFIPNDDPENKKDIDHINRDRTDYHISNLRWVSRTENNYNKSSNLSVKYEYFDKIDDDAIEVRDYGNHQFEFYYYVEADDSFYYYNGVNYRKLHINFDKKSETAFVSMYDKNNKIAHVYLNKFKRLYDIEF